MVVAGLVVIVFGGGHDSAARDDISAGLILEPAGVDPTRHEKERLKHLAYGPISRLRKCLKHLVPPILSDGRTILNLGI